MRKEISSIIISRTDSIGDVVLTLPVAGELRNAFPNAELIFLGSGYTRAVVEASSHIDRFLDWKELAQKDTPEQVDRLKETGAEMIIHVFPVREIARLAKLAGIPQRLGTTNRLYHWFTCNRLVRLSRRHSDLHEAELNLRLISGITGRKPPRREEIPALYGLDRVKAPDKKWSEMVQSNRFNLILHPGSKGSAREWGVENFKRLAGLLPRDKFRVFVTGTHEEGKKLQADGFFNGDHGMVNLTGEMSLGELMSFILICDGLVAASTGPLHLSAALGKHALGIYPPIRPMHPGRWAPLGMKAGYFVLDKDCNDCRTSLECHCMREILPEEVAKRLLELL